MAPWGRDRSAIGVIAHKGWEHRPEERMCQQIFFFWAWARPTTNPLAFIMTEGGVPRGPHLLYIGRLEHRLISGGCHSQSDTWMSPPPLAPSFLSPSPERIRRNCSVHPARGVHRNRSGNNHHCLNNEHVTSVKIWTWLQLHQHFYQFGWRICNLRHLVRPSTKLHESSYQFRFF